MFLKKFNPQLFLAAFGAGGLAVLPFVLLQFAIPEKSCLLMQADIISAAGSDFCLVTGEDVTAQNHIFYKFLEIMMLFFSLLHIFLNLVLGIEFIKWIFSKEMEEFIQNPLKNSAIMAPFLSLLMSFNVFIGVGGYFIPYISQNIQSLLYIGAAMWFSFYIIIIGIEIWLLIHSFKTQFDVNKISFNWLIRPFALAMLSLIGFGIAALSKDVNFATIIAILSLVPLTASVFLFLLILPQVFRNFLKAPSLPDPNLLPSVFIVIPIIIIFSLSLFRFGRFLEFSYNYELGPYYFIILGSALGFSIWYLIFAFILLLNYFINNHFKEFYPSQWAMICAFVALGVLSALSSAWVIKDEMMKIFSYLFLFLGIIFFIELSIKQIKCLLTQNFECTFSQKNER